jgi:hypothetical protein
MGGFRMRKSMKVAPGVRLNVSKRGVGASVGAGGVRTARWRQLETRQGPTIAMLASLCSAIDLGFWSFLS